jgi:hypothetical protein
MTHTVGTTRRYREADLGAVCDVCVRTAEVEVEASGEVERNALYLTRSL